MTRSVPNCFAVFGLLLLIAAPARAQFSPDSPVGISAGLAKLFGNATGFTAKAEVQVLDTNRQETLRSPMGFAFLDGRMRMEIDMMQMKGRAITPAIAAAFKQIGLERIVSIVRLDRKKIYLVFTGARSFASMEMSPTDSEAAQKNLQIQKTVLGKETIDSHPCVRNKVLVKNSKGTPLLEATTWNATDLKDFPLQIIVQSKDNTTILRFNQVQFARPGPAQFEPPKGYANYPSPELLVMGVSQKQTTPPPSAAARKPAKVSPGSAARTKK